MKTRIVLLTSLFFISSLSFNAQQDDGDASRAAKKQVVPGVKIGVNRSNVWDANGESFVADPRSGYALGGYLAIPLGSFLGFQPELMLQEKGFKASGRFEGMDYSVSRRTTHLDVPLQLMVKPFRWFTFLIGPQYSYLLKQDDALNIEGSNVQREQEFKDVSLRKNLFGTLVGIDLNFRHIVVSWRSGWDVTSNHGDGTSSSPRYRNRWSQLTLGYRFY
jgi:hypothetical protein